MIGGRPVLAARTRRDGTATVARIDPPTTTELLSHLISAGAVSIKLRTVV